MDPTNRALGGYNLIPLAVGRVITQVMPMTGTFLGMTDAYLGLSVDGEVCREFATVHLRIDVALSGDLLDAVLVDDLGARSSSCLENLLHLVPWCSARRCDHCLPRAAARADPDIRRGYVSDCVGR